MTRNRVSPEQLAILRVVASRPWVIHDHIYETVYGIPFTRRDRKASSVTVSPAIRASVSRSLKRLESRNLVGRTDTGCIVATDSGKILIG